jgi:hypothetical protein
MSSTLFERAEVFIWKNARLLERQLFAYHFKSGSREAVVEAIRAYQNPDGGFETRWNQICAVQTANPSPFSYENTSKSRISMNIWTRSNPANKTMAGGTLLGMRLARAAGWSGGEQ